MLASVRLALVLGPLVLLAGCASRRGPLPRAPSTDASPRGEGLHGQLAAAQAEEHARDSVPRVIQRIVAEQTDLVARSRSMASELPDPNGRTRAFAEVDALARELARITVLIAPDGIGAGRSDVLDAVVTELLLLDTRITLQHEKLRTATERTTAVLIE